MSDSWPDGEERPFKSSDVDRLDEIDGLCDRFEREWMAGGRPRLEDFVSSAAGPQQRELLCELVAVELEHRRKAGETPRPDEYAARFPQHVDALEELFPADDTATDLPHAESSGDTPSGGYDSSAAPTLSAAAPRQAASLPPRTRIGNYELIEEIARGGMGIVYKARQANPERIVALKMILSGEFANEEEICRFEKEVEAAGSLEHSHIVRILEAGESGGRRFFSMDYIAGPSLAQVLAAGPLPPREAARLVATVADAVQFAHSLNVIHRDLKPANVLLDGGMVPRITDFGLARRHDVASNLTVTGQILGTPSFISPEQAQNRADKIGPVSDVYSLGAILYATISGRPPFQAATAVETLKQVLEDDPASPRTLNHGIPRDLETICLKCLQKEGSRRYTSAGALRDDLRAWLEGRPIAARPTGALERTAKWIRRRPLAATLVCVIAAALTSLIALQWHHAHVLSKNLAETKALQIKAEAGEAAMRLPAYVPMTNAAAIELFRGDFRAAAQTMNSLGPLNDVVPRAPPGIEPEWNYVMRQLDPPRPELVLTGHEGPAFSVAVSPDGRTLASGDNKGAIRIWNLDTGEMLARIAAHEIEVRALAFSPDGNRLASGGNFRHLKLWDTATWRLVKSVDAHNGTITCLDWRPDGKQIASGGRDGKIRLSDRESLEAERILDAGEGNVVYHVRYAPDGAALFATHVPDGFSKWDLRENSAQAGEPLRTRDNHRSMDLSRDGRFALLGSGRFFALDGRVAAPALPEPCQAELIAGRGNWGASGTDTGTIYLWRWADDPLTGVSRQQWPGHSPNPIFDLAATPDGSRLISAGGDGVVKVWRIAEFQNPTMQWLVGHRSIVKGLSGIAFSPNDQLIASISDDDCVRVYETRDGHLLDSLDLRKHQRKGIAVGFAADNKTLFIQSHASEQGLMIWQPASTLPIRFIPIEQALEMAISSEGNRLALCLRHRPGAEVWDMTTQQPFQTIAGVPSEDWVYPALSPDGRWLAMLRANFTDGAVMLFEIASGIRSEVGGTLGFSSPLAFDPDGHRLAVINPPRLHLIDVATARITDSFHLSVVPCLVGNLSFSPDGEVIAIAFRGPDDMRGQVQLLHLATGRTLLTLQPYEFGALWVRFSNAGRMLASVIPKPDQDGNAGIILWHFDPPRGKKGH